MLQDFFLWFYCLSISDALILIIVVSVVYFLLRFLLEKKHLWQPAIDVLFLAWLVVIVAATLMDRMSGTLSLKPELIPFHSYRTVLNGGNKEILLSNFMNIILFYPAGLLGYGILPTCWSQKRRVFAITAFSALFSIGIEACQYYFALGQAETDDVFHNTLGTWIGTTVCTLQIRKRQWECRT